VYTNVYLAEPARARLSKDAELREAALNAVRGVQGIKHALWGPDLATAAARRSSDPVRRAAALSHHPDRSGDIVVAPMERWILSTAVTTHGTLYSYDQRVPLILFGAGVKTGHYSGAATPADLMPSLSALARVKIASTDGRALNGAVR
jgi:hypothetical protein